jgi:HD superfamily phosphohydrolase
MANKHKIINDPVFGFMQLESDLEYDVLQHPYVQRLGRIRQLGLSNLCIRVRCTAASAIVWVRCT